MRPHGMLTEIDFITEPFALRTNARSHTSTIDRDSHPTTAIASGRSFIRIDSQIKHPALLYMLSDHISPLEPHHHEQDNIVLRNVV